ncbi:hypothetical protein [Bacillus sp. UMB0728]|uniref:hypothetical protein n=1 Tax=Bacillus sp. UMB0728 TaxID=2066052 RepID=UPI000C75CB9B|nr:hypothetical protein [Bacillus sp. UMB0728]PLR72315.1 hypothetical protein CYJ37_12225 [Bacillus sp. UMB0728]
MSPDVEFSLIVGTPVKLDDLGYIYLPTIKEIATIGFTNYQTYLSNLLITKNDFIKMLEIKDDYLSEFNSMSDFEAYRTICIGVPEFKEVVIEALEYFTKSRFSFSDENFFISTDTSSSPLSEDQFYFIQDILRIANNIEKDSDEEDFNPANEMAKKFMDMIKKNKKKQPKRKEKINLISIISSLRWKSCESENINNLTVYQLYDGFSRLNAIDDYHYTLTGIYSGTVDLKKANLSDKHWANIIKK